MINVAGKLREVKEQTSLPLTALDKAIGVLLLKAKNLQIRTLKNKRTQTKKQNKNGERKHTQNSQEIEIL